MILELGVTLWYASMHARHVRIDPPAGYQAAVALGVTPEAMAAANLTVEQAEAALARFAAEHELNNALARATSDASRASERVTRVSEQLRDDPENRELIAELQRSMSDLDSANGSIESSANSLVHAALRGMDAEAVASINRSRASASLGVPPEVGAAGISASDWAVVEAAVVAERRAARREAPIHEEHARVLGELRQRSDVVQARQWLTDRLPQLQVVFERAEPPR